MFCWPLMPPARNPVPPQVKLLGGKFVVAPMLLPDVPPALAVTFTHVSLTAQGRPVKVVAVTAALVVVLVLMVCARLLASVEARAEMAKCVVSCEPATKPPIVPLDQVKAPPIALNSVSAML